MTTHESVVTFLTGEQLEEVKRRQRRRGRRRGEEEADFGRRRRRLLEEGRRRNFFGNVQWFVRTSHCAAFILKVKGIFTLSPTLPDAPKKCSVPQATPSNGSKQATKEFGLQKVSTLPQSVESAPRIWSWCSLGVRHTHIVKIWGRDASALRIWSKIDMCHS